MNQQPRKIIFFQVKKFPEKLLKITKTASFHFENKKPLLFIVEDEKAQKYLDELLWKEPRFSFLPHIISDLPSQDFIVVTQKKNNLNNASSIFNLTTEPLFDLPCKIIYEFEDFTEKKRLNTSQKKFKFYKNHGYLIEAR